MKFFKQRGYGWLRIIKNDLRPLVHETTFAAHPQVFASDKLKRTLQYWCDVRRYKGEARFGDVTDVRVYCAIEYMLKKHAPDLYRAKSELDQMNDIGAQLSIFLNQPIPDLTWWSGPYTSDDRDEFPGYTAIVVSTETPVNFVDENYFIASPTLDGGFARCQLISVRWQGDKPIIRNVYAGVFAVRAHPAVIVMRSQLDRQALIFQAKWCGGLANSSTLKELLADHVPLFAATRIEYSVDLNATTYCVLGLTNVTSRAQLIFDISERFLAEAAL